MHRFLIAGTALVAGVAIAAPMALSADAPAATPPAASAAPEPHNMPGNMGQGMMGRGMMGRGMMGRGVMGQGMMGQGMGSMMGGMHGHAGGMGGPGWMHRMMMHGMRGMTPRQRCEERLARRAGIIAYTIAKLGLTAQQRLLWDKLHGILQTAADRQRQLCAQLKPRAERSQETILDRVDRREQFLAARLDALKQARPALEQFYQALNADQQVIINHPFRH
jgi:LTXXQ motif family protein